MDIHSLVEDKIAADADFQKEIADLSPDEKATKIGEKRNEFINEEFGRLSKADTLAKNYKTRAERAEAEAKELKSTRDTADDTPPVSKKDGEMSTKDTFALLKADVHEDDIDEVVKVSKILGVSIAEALKDATLETILEKRAEKRKLADAANTKSARTTQKTVTDKQVLEDAAKGNVPKAGSDEAERLFWARRGVKRG